MNTHLNLDDAWPAGVLGLPTVDVRSWGPRLRYCAPAALVEEFHREVAPRLTPFLLYGSGDFHHLAGVFIRRIAEPFTLISFDNHPDWDIRPPRWGCGGWINRALELPTVQRAVVWGCGNFELALPARLFANRRALRTGRLQVHAWAERQSPATSRRFGCMTRENWRERFESFAGGLAGQCVYVTIDMDCLRCEEAATNWEGGLFTAADVAWAVAMLAGRARLIGGDLCGAFSPPVYARRWQRLVARWDHPAQRAVEMDEARRRNVEALQTIWPALA